MTEFASGLGWGGFGRVAGTAVDGGGGGLAREDSRELRGGRLGLQSPAEEEHRHHDQVGDHDEKINPKAPSECHDIASEVLQGLTIAAPTNQETDEVHLPLVNLRVRLIAQLCLHHGLLVLHLVAHLARSHFVDFIIQQRHDQDLHAIAHVETRHGAGLQVELLQRSRCAQELNPETHVHVPDAATDDSSGTATLQQEIADGDIHSHSSLHLHGGQDDVLEGCGSAIGFNGEAHRSPDLRSDEATETEAN
mmetsp:Transcript_21124/g.46560  ORF Transcript_21124/g.46560 Transcript_21124/m.46560 type:complete len:250 (-) Transcript_21124:789-1538(-)